MRQEYNAPLASYGIDIGTTFVTAVSTDGKPEPSVYRFRHKGKIAQDILELMGRFNKQDLCIFTGKAGKEIAEQLKAPYIDETAAISKMLGVKNPFEKGHGQIIDIGASSLTLYTIENGSVVDMGKNTLCAAGTGLFLEEQAERLNIDLAEQGESFIENPPLVASRCTVFAKSDLVHHQQEGRTKTELWSGLCRSLVISAVNTLFRGEEIKGKIMICGGVTLNREVMRWFRILFPNVQWIIPAYSEAVVAEGASFIEGISIKHFNLNHSHSHKPFKRQPPLSLVKSHYPSMPDPHVDSFQNETRFHGNIDRVQTVLLGMDIGSTSTKLAVLDAGTLQPVLDIYGRTAGDPVGSAKKIFSSLYEIMGSRPFLVRAFGTTGSGRNLVGKIFDADCIVNEISSHARGTLHFFKDVETIFEIGGQDAKYIRLQNGYVADANMNYVCAAGTGSFVEEQARKLGFNVKDVGRITQDIAPPVTSDRCTVFMEQDLRMLLKEGFSKEEALASVLYSVIQNYLQRVVGNRPVNPHKIYFQGATARNKSLVAALENLLGVEVVVSPFCHLMGAIGAALMAHDRMMKQAGSAWEKIESRFMGRASLGLHVASQTETCGLCHNFCRINHVSRSSGSSTGPGSIHSFSWGYQCGRDADHPVRNEIPGFQLFRLKQKGLCIHNEIVGEVKGEVTLLHTLTDYTFMPLWNRFFNLLGYRVSLSSSSTDAEVKQYSSKMASGDFCFPVKAALGHMVKALERISNSKTGSINPGSSTSMVFFPHLVAGEKELETAHSFFCPYVQGSPSVLKATLERSGIASEKLLSPVMDFRLKREEMGKMIFDALKDRLDIKRGEAVGAFTRAYDYWKDVETSARVSVESFLHEGINRDRPVFLLLGRPYNLHDKGLNLGIPEKIASMGFDVIPLDMLDLDTSWLSASNYYNIFWRYGQRIIAAARWAAKTRTVFPVYLSNFNCGPDSFLLNFVEEELKGKPMLVLELDEHDSDGGYMTRVEAYMDVAEGYLKQKDVEEKKTLPDIYKSERKPGLNGTIWIPAMHFSASRLFSAAFRGFGYNSRHLETENPEALALGKKYLRGGECLPMTLTLGSFLQHIKKEPAGSRHILFMPTTEGPCRFGQYNLMERVVFHRLGLHNLDILSPTSLNTYQGLPEHLRRLLMHAVTSSDFVFKMRCKIRPYEKTGGDSDEVFEEGIKQIERALEMRKNPVRLVKTIASRFASIPVTQEKKPLVGIVGEIYVRCNSFANAGLIDIIEGNGGEAWLTPIHEWFLYTAYIDSFIDKKRGAGFLKRFESILKNYYLFGIEHSYFNAAKAVLHDRREPTVKEIVEVGAGYLPRQFEGEAILTVGRAILFARQGVSMVVNAAPFGCMPGTLSSSLFLEIKEKFKIPFLSIFYDGDLDVNDKIASLLRIPRVV